MARMKSHPKALLLPAIKVGDSPYLNNEIARVWIADEAHGGNFVIAMSSVMNDTGACAWILGRLAVQIASDLAKKHDLNEGEVLESLTRHIAINLQPDAFEPSVIGAEPSSSSESNVVAMDHRKPRRPR
ncbi:MAG: hypothetical protein KGS72_28605 [Cyanobacteria bacterium REEB67]|nr:hypothetical protein [Cyanobacteria bacterium REEB67]